MSFKSIKYPRTLHLPWSSGSNDDKVLTSISHFEDKQVVVTEKRDGENTTLLSNAIHARSLDSGYHSSRSSVKRLQGNIGYLIPDRWRVCGENLYAKHTIEYNNLDTYFEVFSIWDENNVSLSWEDVEAVSKKLGLKTVPVIYRGVWPGQDYLESMWEQKDPSKVEGYVVRLSGEFRYEDFSTSLAKYVQSDFVQTDAHWKHKWTPNILKVK